MFGDTMQPGDTSRLPNRRGGIGVNHGGGRFHDIKFALVFLLDEEETFQLEKHGDISTCDLQG